MQGLMQSFPFSTTPVQPRPLILSFDSGEECSLHHLFSVYRLVEEEEWVVIETEDDDDSAEWN